MLLSFALSFPFSVTCYSDNRHSIFILSNCQRALFVCNWEFLGVIMLRLSLEEIPINSCGFLLPENFKWVPCSDDSLQDRNLWRMTHILIYHFLQHLSSFSTNLFLYFLQLSVDKFLALFPHSSFLFVTF